MPRIDHTTTSGTFSLDGETFEVDNNVWVVGDDHECLVIDAPHELAPIETLIDGRTVRAIMATHAHDDHVRIAPQLAEATGAPVYLHPDDLPLWRQSHGTHEPDVFLYDGMEFTIAGVTMRVLHTPGHAPGACCFYFPELDTVFTGDTLFSGGPGATGRSFSDFDTIMSSIRTRLVTLPAHTRIKPGHGDGAMISEVVPHLPA